MKCMICFNMPVYPKECSECSQIVCDTCCIKHEKTKRRDQPQCMHCRSNNAKTFRDVQSKLLKNIIDKVQVGHKCSRSSEVQVFTVADLKRHVESGECPTYSLKCNCGSLTKFSLDGLRKHLREECEMVRLQCKYCHANDNYPEVITD